MSTNQRYAQPNHTQTTSGPQSPEPTHRGDAAEPASASAAAPRTFEPTNTGDLPPMFDPEAEQTQR
jgi:hypothetical protein